MLGAGRLRPHEYDLMLHLGMSLAYTASADAVPYLTRFLREAPRDRYAADVAGVEAALKRLPR